MAHATLPRLSVIVPIGPNEGELGRLPADLLLLPASVELLLVTCEDPAAWPLQPAVARILAGRALRWISAPPGRAEQLNAGAAAARGEWLWFVHWDSGFDPRLVNALQRCLANGAEGLYFADLRFMADGPRRMALNSWGANRRSRCCGTPFGDQGLLLPRALFARVGGFDPALPYGEDHVITWQVRLAGCPVRPLGAPLWSSARKYRQHGWGGLTLRYQWLWLRQARPYAWRLLRQRLSRAGS